MFGENQLENIINERWREFSLPYGLLLAHSLSGHKSQGWARLKPGTFPGLHMSGKGPSTWVIICYILSCIGREGTGSAAQHPSF